MSIQFTKMQALGNDFVIIDGINQKINITPELAKKIADRHFGIGCDQIIVLEPTQDTNVDFNYTLFNADGSNGEFSGNGTRCVAKFAYDKKIVTKKEIAIGIKSRRLHAFLEENNEIKIDIGAPVFTPTQIPFLAKEEALHYNLELGPTDRIMFGAVSVGNPHAVILVEETQQAQVTSLGSAISKHHLFPQSINVNFMEIIDRQHIRLRVYERGSGETLACGSGASAAVVIGNIWGLLDETVVVEFAVGSLSVTWIGPGNSVFIKGTAERVFEGHW